jgi:RNA polymerase sigma-70 factor (ECF subfamily)
MVANSLNTSVPAPFDFKRDLVALIPFLRAFAYSLCRQHSKAEDLAQEALVKAWRARKTFQPGTNLKAWLFTILRNELYSQNRRDWRQVAWDETAAHCIPAPANAQLWSLELSDTADALHSLPREQREALILIGAAGFSYKEAANICSVAEGTVKSRVARGRQAMLAMLADGKSLAHSNGARASGGSSEVLAQLAEAISIGATRPKHA